MSRASVLADLDPDTVLERVLESAQEMTEARYAALGVLNESKTELERFLTRGVDEEQHRAIGVLPRGRGVLGALIADPVAAAHERRRAGTRAPMGSRRHIRRCTPSSAFQS